MRSGDLLSEGIIYVREGVEAGVAPTEQVGSRWRSRGRERWAEVGTLCMRTCVCAGEG